MRYIQETIYDETVHGPNNDLDIVAGDWRDPDHVLDLREHRIEKLNETDEASPIVVKNALGEHIDIQLWLNANAGRVLILPIVARDRARHNA